LLEVVVLIEVYQGIKEAGSRIGLWDQVSAGCKGVVVKEQSYRKEQGHD